MQFIKAFIMLSFIINQTYTTTIFIPSQWSDITGLQMNNNSEEWIEFFAGKSKHILWVQSIVNIAQMSITVKKLQIIHPVSLTGPHSCMFMQAVALCKDVSEQMFLQGPCWE